MTTLDEEFKKALEDVKKINNILDTEDLLRLYGLYKQANLGENTTLRPSIFNFRGLKKWQAWDNVSDLTKCEAKTQYIHLVAKLSEKETP